MNGITSVGLNNQNYQMTFKAKGDKAAYEVIDKIHDMAKEITRPAAEQRENLIRRYVTRFTEVFGTKSAKNKLVETANKASKEANLEVLRETDPDAYKEAIKRQKEELVMEAYNNAYENFVMKRMMKEDPEKAKVIIHNRIISSMNEAINDIFRPKNLIKMTFDAMTIKLAIGVGKVLSKCDRAVNKIPFVKEARINARNKKLAKYEQYVNQALKDGVLDADHAGTLLAKENLANSEDVNKLIEILNKKDMRDMRHLQELEEKDPELFRIRARMCAEEKVAMMSNWEKLKSIVSNVFKKS